MKELKEKVGELRKRKAWAQEDLAREISVSLSTVQRWENKGVSQHGCLAGNSETFL